MIQSNHLCQAWCNGLRITLTGGVDHLLNETNYEINFWTA